jgi:hypothetical protein
MWLRQRMQRCNTPTLSLAEILMSSRGIAKPAVNLRLPLPPGIDGKRSRDQLSIGYLSIGRAAGRV